MKAIFTAEVTQDPKLGYIVRVSCEGTASGMDAVAAIRGLVDRTAELTRNTPEKILDFVLKESITVPPLVGA